MPLRRIYQLAKNVYHFFQAHAWRIWYGMPDTDMKIYGITGTNGKTTSAFLLDSVLAEAYGRDAVGMLSTAEFHLGGRKEPNETHMTSIKAQVLHRYLRNMKRLGIRHVVFEVTSHALDQHRYAGITLAGGIVLNITHEHLDYHPTMQEYMEAKGKIANMLGSGAPLVLNVSDEWTQKIYTALEGRGLNLLSFTADQAAQVSTKLPGDFNKDNVMAVWMLADAIGIEQEKISSGIMKIDHVPGRMEYITAPAGFSVVIDFALTPDAVQRLYEYLRNETSGKLIAVFGAAGRRDRTKRPKITKIASEFADEIILTQDEPYDDPEEQIYADLERGLEGSDVSWRTIEDRREAIKYALSIAKPGDVVALTGMGNYTTRGVGDKQIPWNDRQVVEELLGL